MIKDVWTKHCLCRQILFYALNMRNKLVFQDILNSKQNNNKQRSPLPPLLILLKLNILISLYTKYVYSLHFMLFMCDNLLLSL